MSEPRTVAIAGITGRLGPALARAFSGAGWRVRGLSRRAPLQGEDLAAPELLLEGLRDDRALLVRLIDGVDTVIDGIGLGEGDAAALLDAVGRCRRPPRHLVFMSSVAEGGREPGRAEHLAWQPDDPYGLGKRAARLRYESQFPGLVHSLVLPQLVAPVDHGQRELPYVEQARAQSRALHAGTGRQRQTLAPVDGVAAVALRLAESPRAVDPGPLNCGPPEPVAVIDAIRALLEGARLDVPVSPHADRAWRGPHGGGDVVVDTARLQRVLPGLRWPDALEAYRRLGAWLADRPITSKRPMPVVRARERRYSGVSVVDVHGVRSPPLLAQPIDALGRLASWLSPSFYLDVGRPCNAACIYCAVPPHADREGYAPLERLAEQIEAGAAAGCDHAIFIGGEPTTYPHLLPALERLKEAGLPGGHAVMTNALRLAEPGFVEQLAESGVATFHLSVDTDDEATFEALSRSPGRFAQQCAGLENALRQPGVNRYVYAAATRLNADGLPSLIHSLARRCERLGVEPPPLLVAFAKPVGDALAHAGAVLLSPEERTRAARAAVEAGRACGVEVGLRHLPACLAPELVPRLMDYYLEDFSVEVATRRRIPYSHNTAHLRPLEACARCGHNAFCPGVYPLEVERFGADAYAPLGEGGLASSSAARA